MRAACCRILRLRLHARAGLPPRDHDSLAAPRSQHACNVALAGALVCCTTACMLCMGACCQKSARMHGQLTHVVFVAGRCMHMAILAQLQPWQSDCLGATAARCAAPAQQDAAQHVGGQLQAIACNYYCKPMYVTTAHHVCRPICSEIVAVLFQSTNFRPL